MDVRPLRMMATPGSSIRTYSVICMQPGLGRIDSLLVITCHLTDPWIQSRGPWSMCLPLMNRTIPCFLIPELDNLIRYLRGDRGPAPITPPNQLSSSAIALLLAVLHRLLQLALRSHTCCPIVTVRQTERNGCLRLRTQGTAYTEQACRGLRAVMLTFRSLLSFTNGFFFSFSRVQASFQKLLYL